MNEEREQRPRIIHLYQRRPGTLGVIACGTAVSSPYQFRDTTERVTCRKCAKLAEGLTDQQRTEIWDNSSERLGLSPLPASPWVRAALKSKAAAEKKAREELAEKAAQARIAKRLARGA